MNRKSGSMGKWMAGIVAAMALTGCGNEQCTKYGEHLASVVMKESKEAGQPVAEDKRAELVKKTIEACNAEPPKKEVLDCALAAESTKAMKKCEGVDEDAKKE
jgi:hypothetical protein